MSAERETAPAHTSPEEIAQIRAAVRALCARYPGEYWRALDRERAYPGEFVEALTKAGFLSALIPEQYGGSGLSMAAAAAIMEEIHKSGCNGAACHAQMYTMGTILRHGSPAQKARWLPGVATGALRLQAFGVTEPTSGTDTLSLATTAARQGDQFLVNGQKVWTSRAEHSDLMLLLARTTPKDKVRRRTEGLSVFVVDMREARSHGLCSTAASPAARRPTWPSSWPPTPPGWPPTRACRLMAATASPRSTTSSASSARRACIRWRRSRPT
jgi:alkylation response protein AidB-like acyl-CoA dehydrogenase